MEWAILGLVGLFGYWYLKGDSLTRSQQASVTPPGPPPSGTPQIDAELHAATSALLDAYNAQGCNGLTTPIVSRFQIAVNMWSHAGHGTFALPYTDGVYDVATDQALHAIANVSLVQCELSFSSSSAPPVPVTEASPFPPPSATPQQVQAVIAAGPTTAQALPNQTLAVQQTQTSVDPRIFRSL